MPKPPEGGEDTGLDHNQHLPPTPLVTVLDSGANTFEDLPSLPDSPLGLANFGVFNQESFNTSLRDLVQLDPDHPIGGRLAPPMAQTTRFDTQDPHEEQVNISKHKELPPPLTPTPSCYDDEGISKLVRSRSSVSEPNFEPLTILGRSRNRFSDPFSEAPGRKQHLGRLEGTSSRDRSMSVDSTQSLPMVTAPETPTMVRRLQECSELSYDGPGPDEVLIRDFALEPKALATRVMNENNRTDKRASDARSSLPDCCLSPKFAKETAKVELCSLPHVNEKTQKVRFQSINESINNTTVSKPTADIEVTKATIDQVQADGKLLNPPNAPKAEGSIPGPNVPLPLPIDITGQLKTPPTPQPGKKMNTGSGGDRKINHAIRIVRRLVLRRRLLNVAIGRQLAAPTKEALKMIAKGIPIQPDVAGIQELASGPAPAAPPPAI